VELLSSWGLEEEQFARGARCCLIRAQERCDVPLRQAFDLGGELALHVDLEGDAPVDHLGGVAGGDECGLGRAEDVLEQARTTLSLMYVVAVVRSWS
jgi:hypothetical protein